MSDVTLILDKDDYLEYGVLGVTLNPSSSLD